VTQVGGKEKPDWETLLLHITLAGFLILMLGAVLFRANRYLEVLMFPFFLLTPLWLMKMAQRSMVRLGQAKAFLAIMISLLTAAFFVRVVHLGLEMGPSCKKCRPAIPYEELAAVLREGGIASGTIIAGDGHLAGNLRGLLPYARIVCLQPSYGPPPRANDFSSTAIVVWQPKGEDRSLPNGAVEEIARLGGKLRGSPEKVSLEQQPFLLTSTPRHWDWMVQAVDVTHEKL
jgi:hypothetical protein